MLSFLDAPLVARSRARCRARFTVEVDNPRKLSGNSDRNLAEARLTLPVRGSRRMILRRSIARVSRLERPDLGRSRIDHNMKLDTQRRCIILTTPLINEIARIRHISPI